MTLRPILTTCALLAALAGCAGQLPFGPGAASGVVPLGVLPSAPAPTTGDPLSPAYLLALPDYAGEVPAFAQGGETEKLYRWAAPRERCMRYFQCTCGCEGEGHKSNWNCYVKEVRADGTVVWDPMAAG